MSNIFVSVIIPTYNNPDELIRAVRSIFIQTYKTIEIIIVNDGSDIDYKATLDLLQNESPFPLHFFKKSNEGPGLARQFGLNKASGKYIQYLDSDDELLPHKIEHQVEILNDHPDIVMTYGLSMLNHDTKKIHRQKNERNQISELLQDVLEIRKWHTSSCLWHYPKGNYWVSQFNGEDVLHDFNVAILTKKKVYFTNSIMTNINTLNIDTRLSNAGGDVSNHERMANDFMNMNILMYEALKSENLLNVAKYADPLGERMLHASMRIYLLGYKKDSLKLIAIALATTKSIVKKIELQILKVLIKLPEKNKRKIFQRFYSVRRKMHSSKIHQYRYI